MQARRSLAPLVLILSLTVGPALAGDRWLHVRVEESGSQQEKVHVNIPLSVVESMLPLIQMEELQNGVLQLDALDMGEIDLFEVLTALRETPDTDFVTVQNGNETIRVAKENDYLIVRAEEHGRRSSETVRVRMPLDVVDALVGGDANRLDLVAALRALGDHENEDLISVVSDDSTVRVWIDSDNSGE